MACYGRALPLPFSNDRDSKRVLTELELRYFIVTVRTRYCVETGNRLCFLKDYFFSIENHKHITKFVDHRKAQYMIPDIRPFSHDRPLVIELKILI